MSSVQIPEPDQAHHGSRRIRCIAVIREGRLAIPQDRLSDLKERLAKTLWPSEIENSGWSYGANLQTIKEFCECWASTFDWRAWEAKLNAHPQFVASLDGVEIHFLHIASKNKQAVPLLLTHGWPSSVFEYLKIIPLLREDFSLVIPSLPGHGSAAPTARPGLSIYAVASLWHQLMTNELGYDKYGVQGGDWGAYCSSRMAFEFPNSILGLHLSYVVGGLMPDLGPKSTPLTPDEKAMLERRRQWSENEGGYEHLQSTKPQTLAFALIDSPAGLCAWILEKWNSWTDCSGRLESRFTKDELLANVSWYWLTRSIGSAIRLYYETAKAPWNLGPGERIGVPTAVASFPKELVVSPREWAERIYNVQQWTEMSRGGHFGAIEEPEALATDIKKFFLGRAPRAKQP